MTDTPAPPDGPPWLVVHTKPRCEKKFADLLRREKLEHDLPLVKSIKRYRTQTKRFTKPLFPGYVFARVEPVLRIRLYQQDLMVRFLDVTDQDQFVHQLETIRRMVRTELELKLTPLLAKGMRVRVVGGPLHGVEGMVDDPQNPRGVVVAMDVLQQGVLVRMAPENLEIIQPGE